MISFAKQLSAKENVFVPHAPAATAVRNGESVWFWRSSSDPLSVAAACGVVRIASVIVAPMDEMTMRVYTSFIDSERQRIANAKKRQRHLTNQLLNRQNHLLKLLHATRVANGDERLTGAHSSDQEQPLTDDDDGDDPVQKRRRTETESH
jgi:hypothetical protein